MAKAERFNILYNGKEIINNSPKNSVAYYIIKHLVEKRDYKYEELQNLFNNINKLNVKAKEIIKKKENISIFRDKAEQNEKGSMKSRQRSYLPNKDTEFIVCKNNNNENVEFGVWTEWEYKNFPIFTEYIESLDLGYEIRNVESDTTMLYKMDLLNFLEIIKKQDMKRSYKIALLSCFINNDQMKSSITYDEIFNSLKKYYSLPKHRADLSEIENLESWNKSKYISRMKQTAMEHLPKEYFILDNANEIYKLSDEIEEYVTDPNFVQAYKEAVEFLENKYFNKGGEDIVSEKNTTEKSQEEVIKYILNYITSQGYEYDYDLISNLYLSLKTKPFVILAGISGTGKSKIVRLFSEALGATTKNDQFNMISVRPDWNDSTELIGYKNLESKFIKGKLTQIIEEASDNLYKPYFVCLDEMNLARVEYYLSDYLSVIESRQIIEDTIVTDSLILDSEIEEDNNLKLPENLYLIGTVNMDDTTFQFSRKVLDRANTIEFSDVNLENLFGSEVEEVEAMTEVYNDFIKSTYLKTVHIENEYRDYAKEINKNIIEINNILKKSQKQFAYRVRDEILFYMVENKKANLLDEDTAFDYQIMQKVLPAISGSENTVKETLINLFNFVCEKEILKDVDIEEAESYMSSSNIRYKRSAQKILYMLKGYNYDGYASYWY